MTRLAGCLTDSVPRPLDGWTPTFHHFDMTALPSRLELDFAVLHGNYRDVIIDRATQIDSLDQGSPARLSYIRQQRYQIAISQRNLRLATVRIDSEAEVVRCDS